MQSFPRTEETSNTALNAEFSADAFPSKQFAIWHWNELPPGCLTQRDDATHIRSPIVLYPSH